VASNEIDFYMKASEKNMSTGLLSEMFQ